MVYNGIMRSALSAYPRETNNFSLVILLVMVDAHKIDVVVMEVELVIRTFVEVERLRSYVPYRLLR